MNLRVKCWVKKNRKPINWIFIECSDRQHWPMLFEVRIVVTFGPLGRAGQGLWDCLLTIMAVVTHIVSCDNPQSCTLMICVLFLCYIQLKYIKKKMIGFLSRVHLAPGNNTPLWAALSRSPAAPPEPSLLAFSSKTLRKPSCQDLQTSSRLPNTGARIPLLQTVLLKRFPPTHHPLSGGSRTSTAS